MNKKTCIPKLRFPEFQDAPSWEKTKLKIISPSVFDGTHQTPTYTTEGVPFYSVENIISGNKNKYISHDDYLIATQKNRPEKGDILLTRIGKLGYSQVVTWDHDFSVYVTLAVIKKSDSFDPDYLHSFIQSNFYQAEIRKKSLLNAVPPKINMDELRNTVVLLPEPSEQQKIADCLTTLDDLITEETKKLESLQAHKKGLLQNLFPAEGETIPAFRFPEFQDAPEWEEKPLGGIAENLDNLRIPLTKNDRVEGKIPYYGASGIIDYVEDYIFDEELLCISEDGANLVARTYPIAFSISGKTWVNNHAHVLRFANKSTQILVEHFINSIKIDDFLTGMAQPKLNKAMLDSIPVPLPELSERQKIADYLNSLDELVSAQTQKIETLLAHKKGLLQNLFPNPEEDDSV